MTNGGVQLDFHTRLARVPFAHLSFASCAALFCPILELCSRAVKLDLS